MIKKVILNSKEEALEFDKGKLISVEGLDDGKFEVVYEVEE